MDVSSSLKARNNIDKNLLHSTDTDVPHCCNNLFFPSPTKISYMVPARKQQHEYARSCLLCNIGILFYFMILQMSNFLSRVHLSWHENFFYALLFFSCEMYTGCCLLSGCLLLTASNLSCEMKIKQSSCYWKLQRNLCSMIHRLWKSNCFKSKSIFNFG
jgi:hypothetical protein